MASRLHERRRPPTADEERRVPWLALLSPAERARALRELHVAQPSAGDMVCRTGRPVTYWFGVIDGLLKVSGSTAEGRTTTYTGIAPGGWFGEGTALKRESYRYDVQALRQSRVAGLPIDTFHWLLGRSIGFNRFVLTQLNERLGQFIGTLAADRTFDPEERVAHSLAALANPVLFPGVGDVLRLTQQELAYLVGLSRQRVNEALQELAARGLIRIEYGACACWIWRRCARPLPSQKADAQAAGNRKSSTACRWSLAINIGACPTPANSTIRGRGPRACIRRALSAESKSESAPCSSSVFAAMWS